jgi:hypothetical protein
VKQFLAQHGIEQEVKGQGEKVVTVERKIRVIKERIRTLWNTLPYLVTLELQDWLVQRVVYFINSEPSSSSVDSRSPREKLTGKMLDEKIDLKYEFGEYVQVVDNVTNNSMQSRTQGALALMPTGASDGSWYFLLLSSHVPVRRVKAWKQALTAEVIESINRRAAKQRPSLTKAKDVEVTYFTTEQQDGDDDEHDPQLQNYEIDVINIDHDAAVIDGGIPDIQHDDEEDSGEHGNQEDLNSTEQPGVEQPRSVSIHDISEWAEMSDDDGDTDAHTLEQRHSSSRDQTAETTEVGNNSTEQPPERAGDVAQQTTENISSYNLRPNRHRLMSWRHIAASINQRGQALRDRRRLHTARQRALQKTVLMNLSIKQAIQEHGYDAIISLVKEVTQLSDRGTFEPVDTTQLSADELARVITSKMFLKAKYNAAGDFEKLKSRLVAGGHQQDRTVYDSIAASPTAHTSSSFIVGAIAAKEGRAVAKIDFPGAFLNADMPDDHAPVLMRLGRFESLVLCRVDHSYYKYLKPDGTLVVRLRKGL